MKSPIFYAVFYMMLLGLSVNSNAQAVNPLAYTPDNRVSGLASRGDTLIVAGEFSHVGKYTGGMALFTTTSDQPDNNFPKVETVISSTTDGHGGFYALVSENEYKIIHILPGYTIDPNFSIPALGIMVGHRSIIHHNGIIYVGGINMSSGYGSAAGDLIAFDAATQQLVNTLPHVNGEVKNMRIHNNTLYIIGEFTRVASFSRNGIAAIDLQSHTVKAWYPANAPCLTALGESYSDIVFYGSQAVIGTYLMDNCAAGQPSTYKIVITDTLTGAVNRYLLDNCGIIGSCANGVYWNAGVQKMAIDGSKLYVYTLGTFDTRLTVMDLAHNDAVLWTRYFNMIAQAYEIIVTGNSVFLAGWEMNEIYTLNRSNDDTADIEQTIHNAVKLDATTGAVQNWHPVPVGLVTNDVWTMTLNGNDIFLGGNFSHVNGLERPSVYMLNTVTDEVLPFTIEAYFLDAANAVRCMDNTLYLAGNWSSAFNPGYPGSNRTVRAFDFNTGSEVPLNTGYFGNAVAIEVSDDFVFIAGDIVDTTAGILKTKLIAIDRHTNAIINWAPNPDWNVFTLHLSDNTLYAGGDFDTIAGQYRKHIAAFDATTLQLLPWTADSLGEIHHIRSNDSVLFVTQGHFTLWDNPYGYAGLRKADGSIVARPHDPANMFGSAGLAVRNNTVLAGSSDASWFDTAYCSIRAYNGNSGAMSPDSNLCVNVTGYTNAVELAGNNLYFAGDFRYINNRLSGTHIGKVTFPANYFDTPSTAISEYVKTDAIIYPNPVHSILHISSSEIIYNEIYAIEGKIIVPRNQNTTLNLSALAPGVYFINIYGKDNVKVKTQKIIKQ